MRAKKINEQEENLSPELQVIKDALQLIPSDLEGQEFEIGKEIQVSMDGPDHTNIVIHIAKTGLESYMIEWRAEDLDHENHYDFAGGSEECNSLVELEKYLEGIYEEACDDYDIYEESDEYEYGREEDEEDEEW